MSPSNISYICSNIPDSTLLKGLVLLTNLINDLLIFVFLKKNAYYSIDHNVIAANDSDAAEAMEYDFDYGTEEVSSYVDDELSVGDYMDVFDSEITHNLSKPINETVKIIKNILNEYKKYKK